MELNQLLSLAQECEFTHYGELNVPAMKLHQEVRDMCASGNCHMYGKSWRCPPYCGSLQELDEQIHSYSSGILVQSTADLEDEFDGETMIETQQIHKERFDKMVSMLRESGEKILPLSAGTCTMCKTCTCPDEPCRFPDIAFSSMEASGLLVSEVCEASNIPYYYGKLTITYSSCILFNS